MRLLSSPRLSAGLLVAVAASFSAGCYEPLVGEDTDEVKKRVADASITFQANHDSDRREEIRLLYPRTPVGATKEEVRAFLGDPMPGISEEDKWIYDLGGKDTFTLYFQDDLLKTKHWLSLPIAAVIPSPSTVSSDDAEQNSDQSTDAESGGGGPTVSTGTSSP